MKIDDRERIDAETGARVCEANGYTDYRRFSSGRDACITRMVFTFAILADITQWGYGDRWCYDSHAAAREALAAWDGGHDTEPQGWHRNPPTGRRRENGDPATEYVNW